MVCSIVFPLFPVRAQLKSAKIPTYRIGVNGSRLGNWDGPIASAGFASMYGGDTLEPFFLLPEDWTGDHYDMIPCLATNWTIIPWPNEMNHHPVNPFMNTGGVKAIEITLRDNVTFHDGSAFNATVAKWNIDRHIVITGNLTGKLDESLLGEEMYKAMYSFWLPAAQWAQYETDSWNVSQFIGKTASYSDWGASKTPPGTDIFDTYYNSTYPRIKNVTIIENKASGGKIRINYNDWSGTLLYADFTMISKDAYKDYFDIPIVGLGDASGFSQPDVENGYPDPDVQFPGHLIGTGAYRFIEHNEIIGQGILRKYDGWWNSTAMNITGGWHNVPEVAIVTFPLSVSGFLSRSLAMVTGAIDYAEDDGTLVYDDMVADPDINYVEYGVGTDRIFITLNAINETYWKTWADGGSPLYNLSDPAGPAGEDLSYLYDIDADGTVHVDGINRAMRKAVSYAFDYDDYINNMLGGRAVRSGGFLSSGHEYHNSNIPLAYRNLTIARQALLDDPYWGGICADRGLFYPTENATNNALWQLIADTNPIMAFKLISDGDTVNRVIVFEDSIRDIGLIRSTDPDLKISPSTDIYTVLFTEGARGSVPWFTAHGVPSSWPGANYAFGPYIEYYCKSPTPYIFPNAALINTGFNYNDTVDFWIDKTYFVNRTAGQELWDNLTRHYQTYQYSDIFISHSQYGWAIGKDWEFSPPYLGNAFVIYLPGDVDDGGVQIPGFQTATLLAIAIVTTTGIVVSLKRKRKRPEKYNL